MIDPVFPVNPRAAVRPGVRLKPTRIEKGTRVYIADAQTAQDALAAVRVAPGLSKTDAREWVFRIKNRGALIVAALDRALEMDIAFVCLPYSTNKTTTRRVAIPVHDLLPEGQFTVEDHA